MTGKMKSDTVAVHGGYETEPTTRAVAVPIYQTVAYEFESADHGAALFNLEVESHRYSRISNPTTAVLERRIAELEGGVEALCVRTELANRHRDLAELWATPLDGLIVTGAEPVAADLKDEPYWAALREIGRASCRERVLLGV